MTTKLRETFFYLFIYLFIYFSIFNFILYTKIAITNVGNHYTQQMITYRMKPFFIKYCIVLFIMIISLQNQETNTVS